MNPLNLIRMPVSVPALGQWAAKRNYGWSVRRGPNGRESDAGLDEGKALHHLLAEMFGAATLRPFRSFATPRGHLYELYAYSRSDAAELKEIANAAALPDALDVCDLSRLMSKPMPAEWRSGRRIGFETRVRPVNRLLKPLAQSTGNGFAKGAELDVYLVETLRVASKAPAIVQPSQDEGRSRETVYIEWLGQRLTGAANLTSDVRMVHFARHRAARKGYAPEGPDVVLQGDLIVSDPVQFQEKLASGLGRHKAYGYGMLLLRPARKA
jgi:CRISPR system Cascade subunit CasE